MTAKLSTYDPLSNVDDLTDPAAAEFVASQLNDINQSASIAQGAPKVKNLSELIVDIICETTVQGASTLEVHIADPFWALTTRYDAGQQPAFIDVDDAGLLLPVDVNFPESSGRWWRLCAAEPSIDVSAPNLILTFEDRTVSLLRDLGGGGGKKASAGQTRAQFIASCMKQVPEIRFVCPALSDPPPGTANPVVGNTTTAPSALNPNPPPARANPTKKAGVGRGAKQAAIGSPGGPGISVNTPKGHQMEIDALNPPTNQPDG
jgi:hypothetical protein